MADFQEPQFTGGAVDLGALAQRAEARKEMEGSAFQPFITVTQHDIEAQAFQRSLQIPVVLMIGTSRSPDSESLKATFQELAAGQRGFLVAYVDADATPEVAQMLGVRALPTAVALAAGRPVAEFEGNQPREQLTQWVESLVSNIGPQLQGLSEESQAGEEEQEDPRLAAATDALNVGSFDAAIALYDEILADDPSNKDIAQAKATVGVLKRLDPQNRETDPIQDADTDPENLQKQLDAADAEVVAGAPERAFDRLLALVKTHPEAKTRLLELFSLFDAADPRVIEARTKLASALF